MGLREMQGTPWHAERVHRDEYDDRRYKGRCEFYSYGSEYCRKQNGKCIGSAHCSKYKPISEEEFKKRQKTSQSRNSSAKGTGEDEDIFWY
ncbi:MAG: hypothetical protein SPL99_00550 [Catonella sp.]|nr:hypothetical protein [Catonella sp.]MDY6356582.1 hypothetical protein [Catonella sp.]